MELLLELMQISEDSSDRLLESNMMLLLEDLGNLKQLRIGSMIDAFKQNFYASRKNQVGTTEVGSKIDKTWGNRAGRDSEIIKGTKALKNWNAMRREIEGHETPAAGAVVKFKGEPVAVIVLPHSDALKSRNDVVGLAWDLSKVKLEDDIKKSILATLGSKSEDGWNEKASKTSQFKSDTDIVKFERFYNSDKVEALLKAGKVGNTDRKEVKVPVTDYETWYEAMREGGATLDRSETEVKATLRDMPVGVWDKKSGKGYFIRYRDAFNQKVEVVYQKPKQAKGLAQTSIQVKGFVDSLIAQGDVTVDVILTDTAGLAKKGERQQRGKPLPIKLSDTDIREAKDDLKKRLAFYKASKLETVEDAAAFLTKVLEGKAKKINFAGATYVAVPTAKYLGSNNERGGKHRSFYDDTMNKLITGKPVELQFETDRAKGEYNTLYLNVKLVNGTLTPVDARYYENGKSKTVKF